jgi:uncharacterized damage-inducible protein DinB
MDAKDFLRMFDYDSWANRECIKTMLGEAGSLSPELLGRMAHILSAEKLWLQRILGQPQTLPVWPSSTLADCVALNDEMTLAWRNYLMRLSPQRATGLSARPLQDNVKYRNSKGEPWSSRVEDILIHVLFHSMYHRGQIASEMRASGLTPPYTDFIHAVRQGFVEIPTE